MAKRMEAQDAISAKEGTLFIIVDGQSLEFAELIKLNARLNYTKAEVKSVNRRMKGSKVVGGEGVGDMAIYYHRPELREMAANYVKNGIAPVFDAMVTNADMTSRAGKQTILIRNITPNSAFIAGLDAESDDLLKDEFEFEWDDMDILEAFDIVD